MYRNIRYFPALALLGLLTACGNDNPTTTPTDTTPIPTSVTETFSGTIAIHGSTTHSFVTRSGTVTAQITMLSPDSTAIVGLTLGTWNGDSCQAVITNDRATLNSAVLGQASTLGNLCVRMYDAAGTLTAPTDYEVQVVHPPS